MQSEHDEDLPEAAHYRARKCRNRLIKPEITGGNQFAYRVDSGPTSRKVTGVITIRHSNGVKKFLIADGNHALSRRSRMLHNRAEKIMGITDDE